MSQSAAVFPGWTQPLYLINDAVHIRFVKGQGGVVMQQGRQKALDLTRLNPASVIQVIDAECDWHKHNDAG